jgi:hypothetical protein
MHPGVEKAAAPRALRLQALAAALLIAALWLIARPYRGVRHDGILYLGQTLAHLLPGTIGRDLFLAFGSQDRYSVFSGVMAPLVRLVGVASSQVIALFVCEGVFMSGCWLLTAGLPSRLLRWCSLLSLVSLAHTYAGGGGQLGFAEPFLSGRSGAEALVVVALALYLRGRTAWAMPCTLAALALHPLITLPALATLWIALCLQDRRWIAALALLAMAGLAGAFGLAPFDGLWRRYDADWWTNVVAANPNVFFSAIQVQDWGTAVFDFLVLYLAFRLLEGTALARLIKALAICTAVLTATWALGADLLHDVLLTQLQVWRVYWLVHLLALLLLPLALQDLWRRGAIGRWAAAGLALAAVAVSANLATAPMCILWALLPLFLLRFGAQISPVLARLAMIACIVGMVLVAAVVGMTTHAAVVASPSRFNGVGNVQIVLGLSPVVAAIGYALLRGLAASGAWRWLSGAVLLVLVVVAGNRWDQRSDWQRFVEDGLQESGLPFEGRVPESATVYWDASLLDPWLLMNRQQFFAPDQGAGLLFSRATATEFALRRDAIRPLLMQQDLCNTVAALTGAPATTDCSPALDTIRAVCRAEPRHPDFLVFGAKPDSDATGAAAVWTYRPGDPVHARTYRLYDCAQLH